MTLNYGFQGQLRSKVKTDLNSQHIVSHLLPIQTMALSSTVFEIFIIFICMGNPILTPNFGFLGVKHPHIVTVKHFNPQKAIPYANPRLLSHFALIWHFPFGLRACQGRKKIYFTLSPERSHWSQMRPIQTMALSVRPTVFEIFIIFICMENPIPTLIFGGFEVKHPKS